MKLIVNRPQTSMGVAVWRVEFRLWDSGFGVSLCLEP